MNNKKLKKILSFCLAFVMVFTTFAVALPTMVSAGVVLPDGYAMKIDEATANVAEDNYTTTIKLNVVERRPSGIFGAENALLGYYGASSNGCNNADSKNSDDNIYSPFDKKGDVTKSNSSTYFPSYVYIQATDRFFDCGVDYQLKDLTLTVNDKNVLADLNENSKTVQYASRITHQEDDTSKEPTYGFLDIYKWHPYYPQKTVFDAYRFTTYDQTRINVPTSAYPYLDKYYAALSENAVTIPKSGSTIVTSTFKGVDQYGVKYSPNNITYSFADGTTEKTGLKINPSTGDVTIKNDANKLDISSISVIATAKTANTTKGECKEVVGTINLAKTEYKVEFDNGYATQYVKYGKNASYPTENPKLEGYTFKEWDKTLDDLINITEDKEVKSVFSMNTYTVYFKNGDTIVGKDTYTKADPTVSFPSNPSTDWYNKSWPTFVAEFGDVFEFTVNAVTDTNKEYTIDFYLDGNKVGSEKYTIATKDSVAAPNVKAKDGYEYQWPGFTPGAKDGRVDATSKPIVYTANFVDEDGNVVPNGGINYTVETASLTNPEVPTKTGYTVTWPNVTYPLPVGGTEIKAVYTINTYEVNFVVDGVTVDTQTVDYNTAATAPTVADKAGFTFDGWDVAFDKITDDTTVTAKWKAVPAVVIDDRTPQASAPMATAPAEDNDSAITIMPEASYIEITEKTPEAAANTNDSANIAVWGVLAGVTLAGTAVVRKKHEND